MVGDQGWGTIPMLSINIKAALLNYSSLMAFLTWRFYVSSWLIGHIVTQNVSIQQTIQWYEYGCLSISAPAQSPPSSTAEHCLSKKKLQRKEEHESTLQQARLKQWIQSCWKIKMMKKVIIITLHNSYNNSSHSTTNYIQLHPTTL